MTPATRARPFVDALFLVCVFALGEMAYWTYTKEITHYRVIDWDFLWMIPVAYALIGAVILALGVPVRVTRGQWPSALIVALLAFCGLTGWFRDWVRSLHPLAAVLLALGIGVQLSRLVKHRPDLWRRGVALLLPPVLIATVGAAGAAFFYPKWKERQEHQRLAHAPAGAPNVLLIVLDTFRGDLFSSAGYSRPTTPNLDAFLKRGTTFSQAFATAPWTLPSHGSMFTGTLPHEQSGSWMRPLDDAHPVVAEVLGHAGYFTSGFVANTSYGDAAFGLARGFLHYEARIRSVPSILQRAAFVDALGQLPRLSRLTTVVNARKTAGDVNDAFLGWLDARDSSRPYFAFLNYFDTHAPYWAPAPFATRFTNGRAPRNNPWQRALDSWRPAEQQEFRDAYDGAVSYVDHTVGELLTKLDQRGELAHTIVIITADHGEQFGEHNLIEHAASLYLPLLHVPLAVVFPPQVPADRRINEPVSLRDLAATMLDLTGVADARIPGRSLRRMWSEDATPEPVIAEVEKSSEGFPASYPARRGKMGSVIDGGYHYIVNYGTKQEELYLMGTDAAEQHNLAESHAEMLDRYRKLLEAATQTPTPQRAAVRK